jgi:ABC-type Zn uptake system ZnuABC Zn-binding protein ZnuA
VAAESFLADITANIAGHRLRVASLIPPDVDPHEFQPRSRDLALLSGAKAIVVNGLGYEAWLAGILKSLGGARVIVATKGLAGPNPHLWMDPRKVLSYVDAIEEGLGDLDPAGRALYAANSEAYKKRLVDLDAAIRASLAALAPERRLLITNHDALGAFAAAYGFTVVGALVPGSSSEASPSARALAGIVDTMKRTGARAIFLDAGENSTIAREIAAETGARVITALHVEGLSAPDGPAPTYLEMLAFDAKTIVEALE